MRRRGGAYLGKVEGATGIVYWRILRVGPLRPGEQRSKLIGRVDTVTPEALAKARRKYRVHETRNERIDREIRKMAQLEGRLINGQIT